MLDLGTHLSKALVLGPHPARELLSRLGFFLHRPQHACAPCRTLLPFARISRRRARLVLTAPCCRGACRSAWRRRSASMFWSRRWLVTASRRSSTRTRAVSSRARRSPAFWRATASRSAWMERALGGSTFVERLWRSVKYEEVYLKAYDSAGEARASIGKYLEFYNGRRPHSSLDGVTPIGPTSTTTRCRSARQPNPGRGSTYQSGNSVQTTGATSLVKSPKSQRGILRTIPNRRGSGWAKVPLMKRSTILHSNAELRLRWAKSTRCRNTLLFWLQRAAARLPSVATASGVCS